MPLQPVNRDEVLALVKSRGPIIPNELKKLMKQGDTVVFGAVLSELASKGHVKISSTKIGGSPFYYDPGNPASLERIAEHLNEKDQRTQRLLKEKKVLRDDEQEMLIRVSLRNIKDFAVQLSVTAGEDDLVFWKYYLVPDTEAEAIIRRMLGEPVAATPVPETPAQPATQARSADAPTDARQKEQRNESAERTGTSNQVTPDTPANERKTSTANPEASNQAVPASQQGRSTPSASEASTDDDEFIAELPEEARQITTAKPRGKAERAEKAESRPAQAEPRAKQPKPIQQQLPPLPQQPIADEFYTQIKAFFDESGIAIKEQKLLKKGELDLVILIPTPVGQLEFFCKAKAKKKNSEGDLAAAKLEGHARNLPVLYLTNGEVAKKAKEQLATTLKGVVVKELG